MRQREDALPADRALSVHPSRRVFEFSLVSAPRSRVARCSLFLEADVEPPVRRTAQLRVHHGECPHDRALVGKLSAQIPASV